MNRTVTGYEPRFDIDLRRGQVGEEKVTGVLAALHEGRIEVKTDYGSNYTGNFYIEYEQENRQGEWVPSGLSTTEADVWGFAFTNGIIFVDTDTLKEISREFYLSHYIGQRNGNANSAASRGVLLPIDALVERLRNFS